LGNLTRAFLHDAQRSRAPEKRTPEGSKGAKISTRRLGTSTDCTVRNLSEEGELLIGTSSAGVPNEFELVLSDQTIRRSRATWRTGDKIGVVFC
jgi:hypothetical protein